MARGRGGKRPQGQRRPAPKQEAEPEFRKEDVFEADDRDPEEERQAGKRYDLVDNYEYELPADFEDEEIDEDAAFNSEDERLFGHFFAGERGGDGDESSDEGAGGNESSGGDEDELGHGGGSASDVDLLDSGEDDDDASSNEADDEEDDDRELDAAFAYIAGADGGGGSDDAEELSEGAAGGDREADEALVRAVTGGPEAAGQEPRRKRKRDVVVTEGLPESEYNLPSTGGELTLTDLIAGLGDVKSKLGTSRKALERLQRRAAPVAAPLPGPIQERAERRAGYEDAKANVAKWVPLVKANREAPTLRFTADRSAVPRTATTAALAAKHAPETAMEAEVAALLAAAGADTSRAVAESEEALVARALSTEEAAERRNRLARMRALLFYHEVKAKRLKRIKSKDHRRRLKKAERRRGAAAADADGAETLDKEALRRDQEEAEFERAKERLTLKHKNTSRFIRRALKRGANLLDDGVKGAVEEQLRLGQELRGRVHTLRRHGDGGSDTSASDGDGSGGGTSASDLEQEQQRGEVSGRARKAALELLEGGGPAGEGSDPPPSGLFALPFMQRALEKRRREAQEAARVALDGEGGGGGTLSGAAAGGTARRSFGGGEDAAKARAQERVRRLEADSDSGFDSDADEDAEAKAERLGRRLRGEPEPGGGTAAVDVRPPGSAHGGGGNSVDGGVGRPAAVMTDGPVTLRLPSAQRTAAAAQQPAQQQESDAGLPPAAAGSGAPSQVGRQRCRASQQERLFAAGAAPSGRARGGGQVGVTLGPAPSAARGQPQQGGAQQAQQARESEELAQPEFVASKTFQGARVGYAYTSGPAGVGYYLDARQAGAAAREQRRGKRKAAAAAAVQAAAEPPGGEVDGSGVMAPAADGSGGALSQAELVRRAFAGDDVVAEFEAAKAAEVEGELPKEEVPGVLPGWGTWASSQRQPRWVAEAAAKAAARRDSAAAARKDAKLQYVVISEKWDRRNAKYRTPSLPYPYDSKDTYERAMRQPLGREFNTDASFRDLTRPAVVKDAGVIIEPIRYSAAVAEHQGKAGKGASRAAVLTVAGGMPKRAKKKA